MSKTIRFLIALFALLAATLACGTGSTDANTPADAPKSTDAPKPTEMPEPTEAPKMEIELKVINETQVPLCYLFVAPDDKEFRLEYLDGKEIAPGESFSVPGFEPGKYNVRIHDCEKNMVNALYGANMDQELMTWTIKEATLEIANKSSQEFCELYISPSSAPESAWGPNQLGDKKFEMQTQLSYFLAKGKWDIRAVPCDKSVDPIKEIGFKVEDTSTWTISDK